MPASGSQTGKFYFYKYHKVLLLDYIICIFVGLGTQKLKDKKLLKHMDQICRTYKTFDFTHGNHGTMGLNSSYMSYRNLLTF